MIVPRTGQRAVPRDGHRVHHFGDLSLRWRILLSQLPLTVSAVLVTLAVLLIDPTSPPARRICWAVWRGSSL